MAKVNRLAPFISKWEGGFVNDPIDTGGATMAGVTITTYRAYCQKKGYPRATVTRLRKMSREEWLDILKTMYWDRWHADSIECQSLANILVDWVWASGVWGIKIPQRILGVAQDGIVGKKTLAVLNSSNPEELFLKIQEERRKFVQRIVDRRPSQVRFLKGWLNRINDLEYKS